MLRTTQQYSEASAFSNSSHIRPAGKAIYTLPVRALSQGASDEQTRGYLEAVVEAAAGGHAIDLRVDWDGDASNLGQFDVLVGPGAWEECKLIDLGVHKDVIGTAEKLSGETFLARFQRGPVYGASSFGVKAMPIVWLQALPAVLDPSYVAERGKDYDYEAGIQPEIVPWTYSVLSNGVHKLTLELSMGRDYEVWVRLQDPKNPNNWHIQDPIVRPGTGGGDPF
jgi:hypothetical protein